MSGISSGFARSSTPVTEQEGTEVRCNITIAGHDIREDFSWEGRNLNTEGFHVILKIRYLSSEQ